MRILALMMAGLAAFAWAAPPASAQPQRAEAAEEEAESPGAAKLRDALALLRNGADIAANADEAQQALRAAIAADPTLAEAHHNLVVLLLNTGRLDDADKASQAFSAALPSSGLALATRGLVQERRGDRGRAEQSYTAALEQERTSTPANNYFGGKSLAAGEYQDAIRYSRLALVGDPDSLNAYHNLAAAYYKTGLHELARLICLNALGIDNTSAPMHNMLGLVLLELGQVRDALAEFNTAIKHDPKFIDAHVNAGAVTLNYSDFGTALGHFDAVLAEHPTDTEARLSRAVCLRGLERYDEAKQAYAAILDASPNDVEARYNLCILFNEYTAEYDKALETCSALESALPADHPKKEELATRVKGIKTTIEALKSGG
jgi:tetratricopeptide (TPR) repeat protein